jgi:membrane-bound metal-dependent hydrolase YbcI (DUF457 family)
VIQAALHLAIAALLCFLAGDVPLLIFAASLLLALLPDIDTPKSLIGSLLKPISVPLERRFGHRTATHSVFAVALVAGVAYLLAPTSWMVLAGAYASHLVLDLLIGVQGIILLWPVGEFMTLTAWRDNGRAPKLLLALLLPATIIAATWAQLGPLLNAPINAAVAAANPIATPKPIATREPSIRLHFDLPAGVGLSAVRVKAGDTLAEGQTLAAWSIAESTPWPTPTAPPLPRAPSVDAARAPITDADASHALNEAQAARTALTTAQSAARAALLADQQRATADQQRVLADAQRALDQLQPQHERDQQEAQHAVDAAHEALLDAHAAAALPMVATALPETVAAAAQRAAERIHAAEAALRSALDAHDQLRTDQGIGRAEAEAKVAQAQADLDSLPAQQRQALATLDADHQAAQILVTSRIASARGQAADAQRATAREAMIVAATTTAVATTWQTQITATAQAHQIAADATAQAIPTPAPNTIVSHAAGKVVNVSAEEQDGLLTVTIELTNTQ